MRRHIRKSTSCFLFVLVLMSPVLVSMAAEAAFISFRFEGRVTDLENLPVVSIGDTFSGVLHYNTNLLLDSLPADPVLGHYKLDPVGSAAGMSIVVNNPFLPAYSQSPSKAFDAWVCDDGPCKVSWEKDVASFEAWGPDKAFVISLALFGEHLDIWDSDALPTEIDLSNFHQFVVVTIFESHSHFFGTLTEISRVDEPYVLPSVLAGLLLVTLLGARRRQVLGSQPSSPISVGGPWKSQRKPG